MQKTPFSIYQKDLEPLRFTPKNSDGHLYDVLILGGGFTGISAALELAEGGLNVGVIEAYEIGNGGSGRNGGHLLPDWPSSFSKISKYLTQDEADIAWDIGASTVALARRRIEKYKIDCDLRLGYVHCAYHDGHLRDLHDMAEEYSTRGIGGLEMLDNKPALQTHLGTDAYIAGLYERGAGHIQPLKYLHGLAKAAVKAGADIHQNTLIDDIDIAQDNSPHRLISADGRQFTGRHLLICGNGYIQKKAPRKMQRTLANVTSSVLATKPLSDNLIKSLMPTGVAAADGNTALNYYRIDAEGRMIFGGRASYMIPDDPAVIGRDLRRRMLSVFPELEQTEIEHIWSGRIGITASRIPQFGSLGRGCYFVQGFSGHGVALSGMSGKILADHILSLEAIGTDSQESRDSRRQDRKQNRDSRASDSVFAHSLEGIDQSRFEILSKIGHLPFPGGPLRTPILALGMAYYKLRDRLRV